VSAATVAASYLNALSPRQREALAGAYAGSLAADGLAVYRAGDDTFVPIPPVLSPEPVDGELMVRLSADARLLLSATVKLAAWTLGAGATWGERLYASFTPLELACLAQGPARLSQVATARVDYFLDPAGAPRALELNATIPAMQGYSDLIAHAWVRALAGERQLSQDEIASLIARVGSNSRELLDSIVWHYRARGGTAATPSILIVSRRGDAQLGELRHYERVWSAADHYVRHARVDEVAYDPGDGRPTARGERFDLVYRHIFARRVDPESPFGKMLVDPHPGTIVMNPVVSPLEVKGMLAFLHEALADDKARRAYRFTDEERDAVARVVPWTRLLATTGSRLSDGTWVDDLAGWVADNPQRVVLKRSWDYGGKSVILGPEAHEPEVTARMQETLGAGDWRGFVAAAARDRDLWVVQEFVPPTPRRHLLVEPGPAARWRDLYVDISAYANLGEGAPRPRGGACRASGSRIVNILGGGGLTPLVPADVVTELCAR
jgi:hypothetical protein